MLLTLFQHLTVYFHTTFKNLKQHVNLSVIKLIFCTVRTNHSEYYKHTRLSSLSYLSGYSESEKACPVFPKFYSPLKYMK